MSTTNITAVATTTETGGANGPAGARQWFNVTFAEDDTYGKEAGTYEYALTGDGALLDDEGYPVDSNEYLRAAVLRAINNVAAPDALEGTYRAAYFAAPQSAGVVLTAPKHADRSDAELRAEAEAEAERAGLIGTDAHQVTPEQFAAGLHVGQWKE